MPQGLHRYYGAGFLHFVTTSCYRQMPLLGSAKARDLFVAVLEEVRRRYDFVVWNEHKWAQKLRYMHWNPVVRGLVLEPEQWRWSSYRHYAYGESGVVLVNELQKAELKVVPSAVVPTLRKPRRVGQPR